MSRKVVITVDYEIFGNGAGDVRQHVIEPTERMARLADKLGVPLVVFFELEEYLAFERHARDLRRKLSYDPAALMLEQVQGLVRRGHDVQLHLHPEWHGASPANDGWQLTDCHTVDDLFETQEETTSYIAERKNRLEEMLSTASPHHRIKAYRAGAFAARPGLKLLRALQESGISIDSSVVKGLHTRTDGGLDYRHAPSSKGPWRVSSDVTREDTAGRVWEFPIYSVMRRRLHQLTPYRLRAKFSRHVPKDHQKQLVRQLGVQANLLQMLRLLWQPVPIKLDYHNVSASSLWRWIRSAPPPVNGEPDVVVLIGHTKEHIHDRPFERLLQLIKREAFLDIVSFSTVARLLPDGGPAH